MTAAAVALSLAAAPKRVVAQQWPHYGGDLGGRNYSDLANINRDNVSNLEVAWTWSTAEEPFRFRDEERKFRPGPFQATPIMVNDTLFLSTPFNRVVALDADTGRLIWHFNPEVHRDGWLRQDMFVHRGVAQWSDGITRRIYLNTRWRLISLDASTGKRVRSFGDNGQVSLLPGLRWDTDPHHIQATSPPVVFDSLVIVGFRVDDFLIFEGDPPGAVQAFDARTGRRVWVFHTVPQAGEPGGGSWKNGSAGRTGHANVWSPMTVDGARGLLYVPVSAPSNDYYGGHRPGDNLHSQSLVCLDARTGELRWSFQMVHHGLWDYDPASPPSLVTVKIGDSMVDAVAIAGKTGFLYVFDRVSGEPVWPIEERSVSSSDVPGEVASPTQPFPIKPPPFAKQGFNADDLIDFTPEIRAAARERISKYRLGPIFTPPSERGTVVMPGWTGGVGWGGTAFDHETGTLYVKASNQASVIRLVRNDSASAAARYVADMSALRGELRLPWGAVDSTDGVLKLPLNKPPYGTLTAIDLERGELRWQVPIGDDQYLREHAALMSLDLPPLGVAGSAGAIVTAGGLVFVAGSGRKLIAVDKDRGVTLWEGDLGAQGDANPMTYRTRSGHQYVVIATGGGRGSEAARLVAFRLPREP